MLQPCRRLFASTTLRPKITLAAALCLVAALLVVSNLPATAANGERVPGQIVPNMFTVNLGGAGAFNIYVTSETHFIVDIAGFFAP